MLWKVFQWRSVSIFNGECSGHISKWLLFLSSCHRHHGIFLGECKRDISFRKLRMIYNRVEAKCTFVLKFKGNVETRVYSLKFKRSIEKLYYVNNYGGLKGNYIDGLILWSIGGPAYVTEFCIQKYSSFVLLSFPLHLDDVQLQP